MTATLSAENCLWKPRSQLVSRLTRLSAIGFPLFCLNGASCGSLPCNDENDTLTAENRLSRRITKWWKTSWLNKSIWRRISRAHRRKRRFNIAKIERSEASIDRNGQRVAEKTVTKAKSRSNATETCNTGKDKDTRHSRTTKKGKACRRQTKSSIKPDATVGDGQNSATETEIPRMEIHGNVVLPQTNDVALPSTTKELTASTRGSSYPIFEDASITCPNQEKCETVPRLDYTCSSARGQSIGHSNRTIKRRKDKVQIKPTSSNATVAGDQGSASNTGILTSDLSIPETTNTTLSLTPIATVDDGKRTSLSATVAGDQGSASNTGILTSDLSIPETTNTTLSLTPIATVDDRKRTSLSATVAGDQGSASNTGILTSDLSIPETTNTTLSLTPQKIDPSSATETSERVKDTARSSVCPDKVGGDQHPIYEVQKFPLLPHYQELIDWIPKRKGLKDLQKLSTLDPEYLEGDRMKLRLDEVEKFVCDNQKNILFDIGRNGRETALREDFKTYQFGKIARVMRQLRHVFDLGPEDFYCLYQPLRQFCGGARVAQAKENMEAVIEILNNLRRLTGDCESRVPEDMRQNLFQKIVGRDPTLADLVFRLSTAFTEAMKKTGGTALDEVTDVVMPSIHQ